MLLRATDQEILKYRTGRVARESRPLPRRWQHRRRRISRITGAGIYTFGGKVAMMGGGAVVAPSGAQGLFNYLQNLSYSSPPYFLIGQDTDCYTSGATVPWNSFSSGSTSAANAQVTGTGGATYVPAIMSCYVQGPANGGAGTQASVTSGSTKLVVELVNSWGAAGGIPEVHCFLNNPSGANPLDTSGLDGGQDLSANAFASGNNCLTNGTTANTNLNNNLNNICALLTQFNYQCIFRPIHESNGNWYWWSWGSTGGIGSGGAGATAANYVALYQYIYNYITFTKGITNLVWAYNLNDQYGGPSEGVNYLAGFPGTSYCQLATIDTYNDTPGTTGANSTGAYTAYIAGGAATVGMPIGICELGNGSATDGSDGTPYQNLLADIKSHMPLCCFARISCQTWAIALNGASNITALMTDSAVINRPALPPLL
jgi:hypothetical protein